MTAASTRIVSSPSRNTSTALSTTAVVGLSCALAVAGVGGAAVSVPPEHDRDDRHGEHDADPDVEADALTLFHDGAERYAVLGRPN